MLTCLHACMMLLAVPCLDLCVLCVYFHAIWLDPCLHIIICLDSCSSMFMCQVSSVYMHVSMPICLDLCFHMPMYLDPYSLHALCYLTCACALHAMFVCLDLSYVCHAMCQCNPFVHFITFSCKQKGRRYKYIDMSQATMFSSFRGLASPFFGYVLFKIPFLPPSFLSQMSCIRYIMPCTIHPHLQSDLCLLSHLYFGSCSRDAGIYFLALCTCIVHDVCIYIPAPSLSV